MTGVLLINLGTPSEPSTRAVRRYLREFLSDPRVIDIPTPLRWLLLNAIILPTRPRKSAAAYRKVWRDDEGSPLAHFSRLQEHALQVALPQHKVLLAMRYGEPSLAGALAQFARAGIDDIVVVPLYPQYASASTGSSLEKLFDLVAPQVAVPRLRVLPEFYDDSGFITAFAAVASPLLAEFKPDHVLLSYHGLPERQVKATDATGSHCLATADCCDRIVPANRRCYRAQCYATSRAIAARLGLANVSTSFQSRLGRTPWIKPYSDLVLRELAARGVKRLAVLCPSFVADCLETLEEVAIRGAEDFKAAGGERLLLVPSLNDHPRWIEALAHMVTRAP
jgi:ferrochelatase